MLIEELDDVITLAKLFNYKVDIDKSIAFEKGRTAISVGVDEKYNNYVIYQDYEMTIRKKNVENLKEVKEILTNLIND